MFYTGKGEVARDAPTMNYGWLEELTPDTEYPELSCMNLVTRWMQFMYTRIPLGVFLGIKKRFTNGMKKILIGKEKTWMTIFFVQYDKNVMNYTAFDNEFIMLYPVPPEWTTNNQGCGSYPDRNRYLKRINNKLHQGAIY